MRPRSLGGSQVGTAKAEPKNPQTTSVSTKVKAESLGIPQKLQLKVDVESGKLIIKKSKDGSDDKFYSHKKSKGHPYHPNHALVQLGFLRVTGQ